MVNRDGTGREMSPIGKMLVLLGLVLVVTGLCLPFLGRIPGLGRLPGDILVKKGSWMFYAPLATCLLVSILLSILLSLFWRR